MKSSLKKGFSFGLTSGIITNLGLVVGLNSTTHSDIVVIGGILIIAIADAMSDALGIHVSEEAENKHSTKEIWAATISTFLSKFFITLTFIIPILLFKLSVAIIISVVWGLGLIIVFNYFMAKRQGVKAYPIILEHLLLAILVVTLTHYIGSWVGTFN